MLFAATHHDVRFACFGCTGSGLIETKDLELAMLQLGMELPEDRLNKLKASVRTHTLQCACSDAFYSRAI
jgi:Ca2+-binding EF-hand superfamily protein